MSRSLGTKSHYEAHSKESYESAMFYEPGPYTNYLCQLVRQRLKLDEAQPSRLLLDIGGGTGNFTSMIVEGTAAHAVVVDPYFLAEDDAEADNKAVRFVKAPAEAFLEPLSTNQTWWRTGFQQVLMKEIVHHLDERVGIFRGIHAGLDSSSVSPSLLIITRPQTDIDYPLWPEARTVWAENQPSLGSIVAELSNAGFVNIEHTVEAYPCSIKLDRWQEMVRQRFWSTFSNFTDEELQRACALMAVTERHRTDGDGVLHFEDRLIFITAHKESL